MFKNLKDKLKKFQKKAEKELKTLDEDRAGKPSKSKKGKPVKTAAFGGRIPKKEIPNIADKRLLGRIPEHQNDNRDWDKIETWAREVGKIFSED